MTPVFAWTPGPMEIIIVLVIGIILFGRKLPEIGRYLGKGIIEFKKGIKGMEDDIEPSATATPQAPVAQTPPQRVPAATPRFDDSAFTQAPKS